MNDRKQLLNKEVAAQKMERMALEVAEQLSGDEAELVMIGVRNSGMVMAEKINNFLKEYITVPVTIMSVSLDKHYPSEIILSSEIDFNDKNILVIDDVCNTGKTLLYAMKPLLAFYPKAIQTMVLVERMHKLFPVKPDYVGMSIATTLQNYIQVQVEDGEITGAFVV